MCFIQFITHFQLRLTEMFVSEEGDDDRMNDVDGVYNRGEKQTKKSRKNTQNIMQLINNSPI